MQERNENVKETGSMLMREDDINTRVDERKRKMKNCLGKDRNSGHSPDVPNRLFSAKWKFDGSL
jgi:hypothetical protein